MSKLLFIQYRPFGAVMNGGDQGTKKNLDMLRRVLGEENVDVYYLHNREGKSSLLEYICGTLLMPFGYFFGVTTHNIKAIVSLSRGYDYVFIERSIFGVIAKELKGAGYGGKIISSFQNIEVLYMEAKMPKHLPFRNVAIQCADKNDRWSCEYSDIVVALNSRDNAELQKRYNRKADIEIPVTLEDKCSAIKFDTKQQTRKQPICLFLGSYFAANNEGIVWFMENIYPHLDVEVKIVGRGMHKLKEEQAELLRDIEVISDAPDLAPYFEDADIMVLPIFAGSGMKVKTCESLMYGKNIIGTDEAFEGYTIEEGVSGWRCNTADEFIACINDFINKPRKRYNAAARQLYMDKYSEQAVIDKFKELCGA
ncbi:MAG: glycosyltransferase [Paludibacteraceae bacterium]|nr:glycosyltransferase [Paludibacteraceae bacterium]